MDAHALLVSQGWRGTGHSLHPTNDETGLKHHLLMKREGNDGRGLGAGKDHKQEAWWMNAFDQALKGIDTSSGSMKQTVTGGRLELDKITSRGAGKYTGTRGLYYSFVKGGTLQGSVGTTGLLTPPDSGAGTPAGDEAQSVDGKKETKEEKKARREARKLRKEEKAARKEAEAAAAAKAAKRIAKEAKKVGETREQRKARHQARRARKLEKRQSNDPKG
jgi:nucleolar protein TMA23